ncbi:hypothetical protein LOAG_05371 [Loa loa]|uniref:Uncharacterized protein n=1 Tax=Loa loa TaxID=7209 RepID=A0A1S0U078_LOALO|nr:hypothetical protein LOAG_05371 [Loa loa]EFO23116.1 hypothetical protein LOAG_05371 [Loa loa]
MIKKFCMLAKGTVCFMYYAFCIKSNHFLVKHRATREKLEYVRKLPTGCYLQQLYLVTTDLGECDTSSEVGIVHLDRICICSLVNTSLRLCMIGSVKVVKEEDSYFVDLQKDQISQISDIARPTTWNDSTRSNGDQ